MRRSSWKYLPITFTDYYYYINKLLKLTKKKLGHIAPRTKVITGLSQPWNAIHQGKNYTMMSYYSLKNGFKYGSFTKTRKPFFFRSKKKKKKNARIPSILY